MSLQLDDDAVLQISGAACAAQGLFVLLAPRTALEFYYPPVCVSGCRLRALQRMPAGQRLEAASPA